MALPRLKPRKALKYSLLLALVYLLYTLWKDQDTWSLESEKRDLETERTGDETGQGHGDDGVKAQDSAGTADRGAAETDKAPDDLDYLKDYYPASNPPDGDLNDETVDDEEHRDYDTYKIDHQNMKHLLLDKPASNDTHLRRINPHLKFIVNIGIESNGNYFTFKNRTIPPPKIDFLRLTDPPWEYLGRRRVTDVQCQPIFDGNKQAINITSTYVKPEERFISDEQYMKLAQDCSRFRAVRGYRDRAVAEEEAGFPLAFSILMYRDFELTERLLRAIYRPQNYYCIHVERFTSHSVFHAASAVANCFPNVFLTYTRFHVKREYMSVLQPEFECMRMLAEYPDWLYFINLTGEEFPLRTNLELVRMLKIYNGANDVEGDFHSRFDYRTKHKWRHGRVIGPKEPPPFNLQVVKAQVHIAVTRGFVDYILHDVRADELLWWLNDTKVPDEIYFGMLNYNPSLQVPGAYTGPIKKGGMMRSLTRYKQFNLKQPCWGNKVSHYICIMGLRMLKRAVRSSAMFANKFHLRYHPAALDCLEEWHHNKTLLEEAGRSTGLNYQVYKTRKIVSNHVT